MIVEVHALRKVYGGASAPVVAVDGIDLAVERGEIFGLLGPNGAGKTTTISICTTRVRATTGSVTIAGVDVSKEPAKARLHMGVVPQYNTLDRALTVLKISTFTAATSVWVLPTHGHAHRHCCNSFS